MTFTSSLLEVFYKIILYSNITHQSSSFILVIEQIEFDVVEVIENIVDFTSNEEDKLEKPVPSDSVSDFPYAQYVLYPIKYHKSETTHRINLFPHTKFVDKSPCINVSMSELNYAFIVRYIHIPISITDHENLC